MHCLPRLHSYCYQERWGFHAVIHVHAVSCRAKEIWQKKVPRYPTTSMQLKLTALSVTLQPPNSTRFFALIIHAFSVLNQNTALKGVQVWECQELRNLDHNSMHWILIRMESSIWWDLVLMDKGVGRERPWAVQALCCNNGAKVN